MAAVILLPPDGEIIPLRDQRNIHRRSDTCKVQIPSHGTKNAIQCRTK